MKAQARLDKAKAKLLTNSIDEYVEDIGEDGDSETYDALDAAYNEIENEILEESESEPETEPEPEPVPEPEVETEPEPEKVIENVIVPAPSYNEIEIEVEEEADEYDEEGNKMNCKSGSWMWSCGDSNFKDAEIQDESIYGDWAPRVDSPVMNRRITLDVREAISV